MDGLQTVKERNSDFFFFSSQEGLHQARLVSLISIKELWIGS